MMSTQQTQNGVPWTQRLRTPFARSIAVSISCNTSTAIGQLRQWAISSVGNVCRLIYYSINGTVSASESPIDLDGESVHIRDTIKVIDSLDICGGDHKKIYHGKAAMLIKLNGN